MLVLAIKQIETVILSKSSKPNAGNIQLYWPGLGCVPGNPLAKPSQTQLLLTLGKKSEIVLDAKHCLPYGWRAY